MHGGAAGSRLAARPGQGHRRHPRHQAQPARGRERRGARREAVVRGVEAHLGGRALRRGRRPALPRGRDEARVHLRSAGLLVRVYDSSRWLLLATLWSLQFIFMRMAVPVFGAGVVAETRALFAALFLLPWVVLIARERLALQAHWRDHLAVGLVNNVLPFILF